MRLRHLALLLGLCLVSCTLAHNPDLPSLDEGNGDGDFGAGGLTGDGDVTGSGGSVGSGGAPVGIGGHPVGGSSDLPIGGAPLGGLGGQL